MKSIHTVPKNIETKNKITGKKKLVNIWNI